MYVKLPSGDLNSSLTPTPNKHLYLWSNHRIKGARWLLTSKLIFSIRCKIEVQFILTMSFDLT